MCDLCLIEIYYFLLLYFFFFDYMLLNKAFIYLRQKDLNFNVYVSLIIERTVENKN